MQKMMMENINKAQQQMVGNVNIPGVDPNNPMMRDINQQIQRDARKTLTKEGEAAKQRLEALRRGNKQPGAAGAAPGGNAASQPQAKRPSLNDAIPKKYKRWRKPGTESNDNNVTI